MSKTNKDFLQEIIKELTWAVDNISETDMEQLLNQILSAKKVFVAGAGRTGLMGKSFCMRLMHMGIDAYVLGETVTSNFEPDDLLILGSGSGGTASLISYGEKAKKIGGKVIAITIKPDSPIAKLSDYVIKMPGAVKERTVSEAQSSQENNNYATIQPMGSLFEQALLLFYDAVILGIMQRNNLDNDKMYGKHANLE